MDISDDDLRTALFAILEDADLQEMTLRKVMAALSERFKVDKSDLVARKAQVRRLIDEYFVTMEPPSQDDEKGDDDAAADDAAEDDEEDVDDFDDDSGTESTRNKQSGSKRGRGSSSKPAKLTGLTRAVVLSEPLADLLGERVMPRNRIQQRVIAYAKENNLQDPKDGRVILADDALRRVFKQSKFSFFSLSKFVSEQVENPADCEDPELQALAEKVDRESLAEQESKRADMIANGGGKSSKRLKKAARRSSGRSGTRSNADEKNGRGRGSGGLSVPMRLSPALASVCGGQDTLSRPQVVKALWGYVKERGLQDPSDGRRVLCDDALAAVFDGERVVSGFSMNKYLSAHLSKVE